MTFPKKEDEGAIFYKASINLIPNPDEDISQRKLHINMLYEYNIKILNKIPAK